MKHGAVCSSLEVGIKPEEEVLAEAFRPAEVSGGADPPQLDPCERLSPASSTIPSLVPAPPAAEPHLVPVCDRKSLLASQAAVGQTNPHSADLKSAEQMMRLVFAI